MIVIATGFIPPLPLLLFRQQLSGKVFSGLDRILCGVLVKEFQESVDRCNGSRDITEILLKTALNTIQSINQSSSLLSRRSIMVLLSKELAKDDQAKYLLPD